jgi:hypothetical protein
VYGVGAAVGVVATVTVAVGVVAGADRLT